ncbi:DsbC family protein [Sideroxydans lithotrophicus]|uniref:Thiol:disulfide interchange protein n=1 Tax=Sideroxydans lithotrophicus (strain ES-1) TaxID=580332 RepID=D5CLE3_SIDLE|nr:DsbC family protein [Sideroxydans lithotrophicus]ADE10531.1 Disulfide bond isomerase, DsbC/G-like protein [Sideroxydans lithotrophicus ES-1]
MFKTLLLLLLSISLAHAAETDKTAAAIKDTLIKNYEQLIGPVDQVNKSPIPGLYEVVTGDHIFYTDKTAQYLIDGQMFDLKGRQNITQARSQKLFAIDFSKLPLELAVKKVKGNGSRKMAYFADPNCGFCKKLEHELQNVNDVTLYLFLYPIFQGSAEKVQDIWCSADKAKTWDDLMLNGVQPKAAKCDAPIAQVLALGKSLRVNGTPALIFANGVINPGYMPAADLNKALDANNK